MWCNQFYKEYCCVRYESIYMMDGEFFILFFTRAKNILHTTVPVCL